MSSAVLLPVSTTVADLTENTGGQQSNRIFSTSALILDNVLQNPLRLIDAELTLGYQGSVTTRFTSPNTVKPAAIYGVTTIATGTTLASGFAFGGMFQLSVQGSLSSANYGTALFAQLDLTEATALGTGPIAGLWVDCGPTFSAAAISGQAVINGVIINNTAPGSSINAVLKAQCLATYFLDVSNTSYPSGWVTASAVSTVVGALKVNAQGSLAYIPLYSSL